MAIPTATVASNISRSMQSPRTTAVCMRVSTGDGKDNERALPMAMANGHGRRLIQMLFRSNNGDDLRQTQRGDDTIVVTSPISIPADSRSEDDVPVGSNKLRALKRKLFPSRKRRHPVRIPPLVVSPIATGPLLSSRRGNNSQEEGGNEELTVERSMERSMGDDEVDPSHTETQLTARDAELQEDDNDDEDFDDDLVDAIEAADRLQSAASDETLMQMNRAIEELHDWKTKHELATQTALKAMDDKLERELAAANNAPEDNVDELAMRSEAERNQRLAEAARARLAHTLKESEESLASERPPNKQIAQVLLEAEQQQSLAEDHANQVDVGVSVLARLREDVFDLGVKALSSSIHATLLQELNDADNSLDLKFADVETFASDLDRVLAQLDAGSLTEAQPNPAGQVAQEH